MIHCVTTGGRVEASTPTYQAFAAITGPDAEMMESLSAWFGDNKAELLRVAIVKGMEELTAMMQQGLAAEREAKE